MQQFEVERGQLNESTDDQDIKTKGKDSASAGTWAFRILIVLLAIAAITGVILYAILGDAKPGS